MACRSHVGGLKVACGWLVGAYPLPSRWLVGGLDVALMWLWGGFGWLAPSPAVISAFYFLLSAFTSWRLCPAFEGPTFEVRGSEFGVHHKLSEYNSPPEHPSGCSGGTLDKPWTCPGTIEPPQTSVFYQPSLSRPLSCGISAAERFRCGADLWSADARSLRLCGACSARLGLWAALPRLSASDILRSGVASGQLSARPAAWAEIEATERPETNARQLRSW